MQKVREVRRLSSIKFTDNSGKVLRAFDAAMERALETIGMVA